MTQPRAQSRTVTFPSLGGQQKFLNERGEPVGIDQFFMLYNSIYLLYLLEKIQGLKNADPNILRDFVYSIKKQNLKLIKILWSGQYFFGWARRTFFTEGKEKKNLYEEILDVCLPCIEKLQTVQYIFQYDGAPSHFSLLRKSYFDDKPFDILEQSPQT